MSLKSQDIMVALKLCSYHRKRPPISIVAADLKMSPSEIHAAIKRLHQARLLHGPEMEDRPNLSALEEFLLHGVKYAFPAERGEVTRGMPTSCLKRPYYPNGPMNVNPRTDFMRRRGGGCCSALGGKVNARPKPPEESGSYSGAST